MIKVESVLVLVHKRRVDHNVKKLKISIKKKSVYSNNISTNG